MSLSFDGDDDKVTLNNIYGFSGADDFSIGMWVYCEDFGSEDYGTVFFNTSTVYFATSSVEALF